LKILDQEMRGAKDRKRMLLRRNIGYIFQAHNLHGSLTAMQNVRMGLEVHPELSSSEMKHRSIEILQHVGLDERVEYYPSDLSGGQKQRVAIARALVSRPKIILADEPTAALDSKSGREVVELMQRLAKEQGCTILMVTHDNRILDVADRIIHMEDGLLTNNEAPQPAPEPSHVA
jgi:putative ABC transport system ATP-binding protein